MKAKKIKIGIRGTDDVLREAAETMKSVAAGKKVRPKGHRLIFTSPEALRRFLGIDDAVPAGPLSGRVAVRLVAGGVQPALLEEIAQWGVTHCPVCDALERPVPVTIEVTTA